MLKRKAVLLVGPTGAGKTPLGAWLERRGLWGRRCAHFDFGANLRTIAASFEVRAAKGRPGALFSLHERAVILDSLATGALLENENFPIAEKIMDEFAGERRFQPDDLLVLNGLPRHAGQARDMERIVDVKAVLSLTATAEVIKERIRIDAGGDRTGRPDDSLEAIEKKLRIFAERTLPLLDFYVSRNVPVLTIAVLAATKPEEILADLERRPVPLI